MSRNRALALTCALAACAGIAAPAAARNTQELGAPGAPAFPPAFPAPDCPMDCQAIAQVTGMNEQLGSAKNPFRVRRPGFVVAFTVRLAKPTADQVTFFKTTYGAKPQARLSLLEPLGHREYRLLKQTQAFDMEPYFGSSPTIALRQPFRVHKDDVVALTVPTWLPAFKHSLPSDEGWRSSHSGSECAAPNPGPAAHEKIGSTATYGCFYRGARLLYSATFVGDPTPTNVAARR